MMIEKQPFIVVLRQYLAESLMMWALRIMSDKHPDTECWYVAFDDALKNIIRGHRI